MNREPADAISAVHRNLHLVLVIPQQRSKQPSLRGVGRDHADAGRLLPAVRAQQPANDDRVGSDGGSSDEDNGDGADMMGSMNEMAAFEAGSWNS